ncbi:MAG: phosphonate ABC transporter, permease protein PhnE [Chloroflexi bacterium]|jgi:phosphonate transport system permease protein|nr:phosphonate ABC transporter, permease protein PhnE [Chloroflexota bacterium]
MANKNHQPKKRDSLVSASVAGIASLIIPGLGQMLARQINRGLVLLGSVISIVGLLIWRVALLASRVTGGPMDKLGKALDRLPFFIGIMIGGTVILWLWNAWDAYRLAQAEEEARGGLAIFFLILALFFALGWQIGEIDLYKAATELPDTLPILTKVLWPWDAAVTRDERVVKAGAPIMIPCSEEEDPPGSPEKVAGEPYVRVDPTCGQLTRQSEDYEKIPGTEVTIMAEGFEPNEPVEIWWENPIGDEYRLLEDGDPVITRTDGQGNFEIQVVLPYRAVPTSATGPQIYEIQARQTFPVGGPKASDPLLQTIERMIETIFLGMMATLFGIVFALPVSFLAAKNLMSGSWFTLGIYYVVRTILNIVRSIEPLIWAIIATQWIGLGPFAGIIALTVHTIAALGKLYSESIENIDPGPIEAIHATGATRLQTIMYAVIPQMIPPFVSFSIYRWDINVRMSTVIGLVGGGGIGFILIQYIRLFQFRSAGIAVWFIAITVAILDYVSAEIRERYV